MAVKTVNVTDIEDILVMRSLYNERTAMLTMILNQKFVAGYDYDVYVGFHGNVTTELYADSGIHAVKSKDGKL